MPAGEQLRQRVQQFVAKFDDAAHVWRVLDTWDKSLESLGAEDEIPDTHQAMTLLPMAAMIEVVRAAEELNLLEHMFGGVPEADLVEAQEQLQFSRTAPAKNSEESPVVKEVLSDQSQVTLAAIEALTKITGQSHIDKVANGRTINA
jgi:hypothetical protein